MKFILVICFTLAACGNIPTRAPAGDPVPTPPAAKDFCHRHPGLPQCV